MTGQPKVTQSDASLQRFLQHLASVAVAPRCELVDVATHDRCRGEAVAVKWEHGFADSVCERHTQTAMDGGAVVVYPHRHDGSETPLTPRSER